MSHARVLDVSREHHNGEGAPRVLVVDNHDSFTYNLVQGLGALGAECSVIRSGECDPRTLTREHFDGVLLSPGPSSPDRAHLSKELLDRWLGSVPMLGVCLGHQVIAQRFGARVERVAPVHGRTSEVLHDNAGLCAGLRNPFPAARYHSLAVTTDSVPPDLVITAWTRDNVVMGLRSAALRLETVQFHPESALTPDGPRLLRNWLTSLKSAPSLEAAVTR